MSVDSPRSGAGRKLLVVLLLGSAVLGWPATDVRAWSPGSGDDPPSGPDQEADQEAPPGLPAGVPVVFLPLQSLGRAPAGGWPDVDGDREAVLERFDDEVAFALGQRRATRAWVTPGRVVDVAGRNPMLDVDPRALAYQGIRNQEEDPLYEPLHGQLRSLTALLDARLVVLPFALRYERGANAGEPRSASRDSTGETVGRGVLEVAIVDTRAGRILWVGRVEGAPAEPSSPGMLTDLADRLVRRLAPS